MVDFDRTENRLLLFAAIGMGLGMVLVLLTVGIGAPIPLRLASAGVLFAGAALSVVALIHKTIRVFRTGGLAAVGAVLIWVFLSIALARGLARLFGW